MTRRKRLTLGEAGVAVVRRLREHGHEALWAGGCVRDMLLDRPPTDIDVATDAPPGRIVELFRNTRQVGAQFGVVMVRQGSHWIETATFRADVDYQDGRRPDHVVFTNAREDAQRRDFTINGLFYDPIERRVIDYVDGQADLRAGIVRAIGEPAQRFAEDHLRMLRAVRFATRLGFDIEPVTADAIREHAGQIVRISPERIREELDKMLGHASRGRAVRLMGELGLLDHLWPESAWTQSLLAGAEAVVAALPQEADFTLSMAGLLHDRPASEATRVARALRCSNQQIDEIRWLVDHVGDVDRAGELTLHELKKLMAHERFGDLLALHEAVCRADGRAADATQTARQRSQSIPPEDVAPPPLVTGDDLIALGMTPGPRFKTILEQLYDEQLDDRILDREKALERLREVTTDTAS